MGIWGDNWVKSRNPRFLATDAQGYFNIIYFSDSFYKEGIWVSLDEVDLYRYVYDNCSDAETISVNTEMENGWFKTLTGNEKAFTYGDLDDFKKLEDDSVGYVVVVYSPAYEVVKDYLGDYEVIYSNAEGMVLKVK